MKKFLTISVVLAATLLFAGCSGSDSGSDTTASSNVEVIGEKSFTIDAYNWRFEPQTIEVEKGTKVTLTLKNNEGLHGITIPEYKVDIKKDGGTATFVADKEGEFTIYCSIMCGADHGKMQTKFIVK